VENRFQITAYTINTIDVYTKAFFLITSLYTLLPDVIKNDVEVDNQIKVSNLLEPELSELVRLFYWINVCRRIIDKESFELKFNEFRGAVQFENESKFRKRLNNKFITFGRIMKDGIISYDNIKAYATQLVIELVF